MSGVFITFEGGEGVGKSTYVKWLETWLNEQGITDITLTREPGKTKGGEAIRDLLLQGAADKWDGTTEALLYFAARRDNYLRIIKPALERGAWVISDRFADSSYAYQGYAHGVPLEKISQLYDICIGDRKPDLTIVLDVDPRIGLARTTKRTGREGKENRFENLDISFHDRLRQGYLELAKAEPNRFAVISAEPSMEEVFSEIIETITTRILNHVNATTKSISHGA